MHQTSYSKGPFSSVWSRQPHRATKDIDLLGFGSPDLTRLELIFREVCQVPVFEDGLGFDPITVHAAPIREEAVYDGVRITFLATLGTARIPVQVDVGFGDSTEPPPEVVELPTLLDHPAPRLHGYRREVAIAEKLHAMVDLGLANSRMKDYSDVWFLARNFDFDGAELASAIRATFKRRQTPIPKGLPTGLTGEFAEAPAKLAQWKAFTRRTQLAVDAPTLQQAIDVTASFAGPVFCTLADGDSFTGVWPPGGPWNISSSEP